jgi:protoporphyrinogen oxidase
MADPSFDVAVLGAGISGLSLAHRAARAGRSCVLLEAAPAAGGCIRTASGPDGFWYELGAHTLYNSYGALLDLLQTLGLREGLQERQKAAFRLLVDGRVRGVPSQLAWGELLLSAWRIFTLRKTNRTVADYFGRLVGRRNWQRVFSPLLAAVPSQHADGFPAEMLFKRRPRRPDSPRTFTLHNGLGTLVERLTRAPGLTLRTGSAAVAIAREATGYAVTSGDGQRTQARRLALALPPDEGARLLAPLLPDAAAALARVAVTTVDSVGVVLAKPDLPWPRLMGLAARGDAFFSIVSRDVVPHERLRALTFHFRPGLRPEDRLARIAAVTGVETARFLHVAEHRSRLPSPALGHAEIVRDLDRAIAGSRIYVTGNYFGGLAIEDCVLRSRAEAERMLAEV